MAAHQDETGINNFLSEKSEYGVGPDSRFIAGHGAPDNKNVEDCASQLSLFEKQSSHCQTFLAKAKKHIKKRLPILEWLPRYSLEDGSADLLAGVAVGMTVIPQGIAYAGLAGLGPEYGLYSAFMGGFIYCLLGTTSSITIGPVSILALMTGVVTKKGPEFSTLLTFFTGIVTLSMGFLQLGFILEFISVPVIAGFVSAANLKIAILQLKPLLGIVVPKGGRSKLQLGVVDGVVDIYNYATTAHLPDAVLGILCASVLLLLRALNSVKWFEPLEGTSTGIRAACTKLSPKLLATIKRIVWFISTGRNAVIVIFCLSLAAFLDPGCVRVMEDIEKIGSSNASCLFRLTGDVEAGIPPLQPPPFRATSDDGTEYEFMEMLKVLGSAVIVTPLIAILECVALAKAFSKGSTVDVNQEMIALGVANIMGSFVGSMPTTASFSRTAINSGSGVRTPLGGVVTGSLILLCLSFLMNYCAFIPKATLAAVIITAVIFNIEYHVVLPIWRSNRLDLVPAVGSFLVCIFYDQLEVGIVVGVVLQIGIVLYHSARPTLSVITMKAPNSEQEYLLVTPDQGITFSSTTYIRHHINKQARHRPLLPVVVDCTRINIIDFTAAKGFKDLIEDLKSRPAGIYWINSNSRVTRAIQSLAGEKFRMLHSVEELLPVVEEQELRPLIAGESPSLV